MLRQYLTRLVPLIFRPALSSATTWSSIIGSLVISIIASYYGLEIHIMDSPAASGFYALIVLLATFLTFSLTRILMAPFEIFKQDQLVLNEFTARKAELEDAVLYSIIVNIVTSHQILNDADSRVNLELIFENVSSRTAQMGEFSYKVADARTVSSPIIFQTKLKSTIIPRNSVKCSHLNFNLKRNVERIFLSIEGSYGSISHPPNIEMARIFEIVLADGPLAARIVQESDKKH